MEEYWRVELDKLFEQVAEYADDWPVLVERIIALPLNKQTYEYLRVLVPRLKVMCRRMNRVVYDTQSHTYTIKNYDDKLYFYFTRKYPDDIVLTPMSISIHTDALTAPDREQLQEKLEPNI